MTSINKVILVGRLGKDPEIRYSQSGEPIASFTLATSEQRKDNNGMRVENTEWHRIVVFKKLAEIVEKYLKKGALVYIEGSIKTNKWKNKDGVDQYTTEIIGNQMQMLGGKQDGGGDEGPRQQRQPAQTRGNGGGRAVPPRSAPVNLDDLDSDIPY